MVETSRIDPVIKLPVIIGILVMVLSTGVFGWKGYRDCKEGCALKEERAFRKQVVGQATEDHFCRRVVYLSGRKSPGIYRLNVCSKVRWYKCDKSSLSASISCKELER